MSAIPEPARPAPRRSRNTFAQAAAAATPDTAVEVAPPTPTAQSGRGGTQTQEVDAVAPARDRKRKARTTDILLSLSEEQKARMVAAQVHTRPRTGIKSQQMFIRAAIDQLCDKLEEQYNRGEPFPTPAPELEI